LFAAGKLLPKEKAIMKTRQETITGAVLALTVLALVKSGSIHADEAEDKAVKAIYRLGDRFARDRQTKDKPIVDVDLRLTDVTDAGLKELAVFKQLRPGTCMPGCGWPSTGLASGPQRPRSAGSASETTGDRAGRPDLAGSAPARKRTLPNDGFFQKKGGS
jgi:hypothetical protein